MSTMLIFHDSTVNQGNFEFINGQTTTNNGLAGSFYLSMFGGNSDDAAEGDTVLEWWGNSLETDSTRRYRSRTQNLLRRLPATTGNLVRVRKAIEFDLKWAISDGTIKQQDIDVTIPRLNWISIVIDSEVGKFEYMEPWEGSDSS